MKTHVLVLNYNGKEILKETVPTILAALSRSKYPCRFSVIDNESRDGSAEWLRGRFPGVGIFEMPNRVLCSYNDVLRKLGEDVVILLNNDLKVREDFIDPLVEPFEAQKDLFLTAPRCLNYEGTEVMGSVTRAYFHWGLLKVTDREAVKDVPQGPVPTFASGSAAAVDRLKFLELGGYDDLYLPGTMEDVDLCFRAWKKGYRCLLEPGSVVYHKGQMSFKKRFGAYGIGEMNARNNYLFIWKNFTDRRYLAEHLLFLPARWAYGILKGQPYWITGFVRALGGAREALRRRRELARQEFKLTERMVLERWR